MLPLHRLLLCTAALSPLITPWAAQAADEALPLPGRPGDFTLSAPAIDEATATGGGWYLRADAGGSRLGAGSGTIGTRSQPYGGPGWTAGLGFGYRFTPHFRADVTADVISHSRLQEKVFLANVYWDLFTVGRVTPYVGLGIGAGEVSLSSTATVAVTLPNLERYDWQAAWSFAAGASWALTPDITLNAGYRFIDLGSPTFDINGRTVDLVMSGIREQQFRLGLRYALK